MNIRGEDLLGGLFALALLPVIGWRIWDGVRHGRLSLYRAPVARSDGAAKFTVLLVLHVLVFLLVAAMAAEFLIGIGLRRALGVPG
jgi:hypothetical protein